MWPFKKKKNERLPCNDIISFTTRRMWTKKEVEAVLGADRTIATYEKIKRERTNWNLVDGTTKRTWLDSKECQARILKDAKRPERKEEKMKIELVAGKWYEVEGKGIHMAEVHPYIAGLYLIGGSAYDSGEFLKGPPRILREVPTPLTLIPGELYAMDNGKVEVCEMGSTNTWYFPYMLGSRSYTANGNPRFRASPRILHRLKVNEHMKADVQDGPASGTLFIKKIEEFKRMMGCLTPALAKAMRPILDEIIARSQPSNTAKRLMEGQAARTASASIPVTYKPHSDCSKREVEIPEGWELAIPSGAYATIQSPGIYGILGGFWVEVSPSDFLPSAPYIRPKPAPFKVDGPGWYKTRGGSWVKDPWIKSLPECYGWSAGGNAEHCHILDLISKATPSQAAVLDTL